jgi:glycine/D-amino acid oxidase-like deaminating enzyme
MKTYDWIVVGGGIAGSALGYELAVAGCSVLLLQEAEATSATRFSYGGIAYWSGTTDLMRQLCQEGIERHRTLSAELDGDTQFQELDLLLTIAPDRDLQAIAALYAGCAIPPQLISAAEACEREPLLDRGAIAGALQVRHGQVSPELTAQAYQQAMVRRGGEVQFGRVTRLLRQGDRVEGAATDQETYRGANVVIAAGGMSRALLRSAGLPVRLYFTHAELIETPSIDLRLRALVMPAELKRFQMEAEAGRAEADARWDKLDGELTPPVLDAGVVQFQDGSLRMGQISRTLPNVDAAIDATQSEAAMRAAVGQVLPALQNVPGQWHHCLVSFSGDRLPLIGGLPGSEGIHLFSGFSNPFALLPPLARRFAQSVTRQDSVTGQEDEVIAQLSPARFAKVPAL